MKPLSRRYIITSYIVGFIVIIILVWTYYDEKSEREQLINNGQICKAIIIKAVDRKRGLDVQYKYVLEGKTYTNWEKVYKDLQLGDEINILYLPTNPATSRPVAEIIELEK